MRNNKSGNYLDKVPMRKPFLTWETAEDGNIVLLVENKGFFHWMAQKLLKKPRISKIHLEEMGSFVWLHIDGERSIYEIGELLKKQFGEKAEPLYERLVPYMQSLVECSFIVFIEKE